MVKLTLHVVHYFNEVGLTVSGSPCKACRMKLLTTRPSFMCMRDPKVLKIRATLTSTPSCETQNHANLMNTVSSAASVNYSTNCEDSGLYAVETQNVLLVYLILCLDNTALIHELLVPISSHFHSIV